MDNETRPTHQVVADRLDLTVATVSRLRSGERLPSLATMQTIKELTAWSLDSQTDARDSGQYHTKLEQRLSDWWAQQPTDSTEPAKA